jgi:hypothetical protein
MTQEQIDAIIVRATQFAEGRALKVKAETTFTIENGRGATYRNGGPTVYGHSEYDRSSVLYGAPLRQWVDKVETWDDAKQLAEAMNKAGLKTEVHNGGSTYITAKQACDMAGLPDDTDY